MAKKVLILHGWQGSPHPHWQSWLAGEIAKEYGTVSFPLIEDPMYPEFEAWNLQFNVHIQTFQPDIVICHSMANSVWFHLCNEGVMQEVEHLLLVAPPRNDLDIAELKTFYPVLLPEQLYAKEALLVCSTNDPYISVDEAKDMAEFLDIDIKIVEDAGHINDESGYGEWPWVLQWVRERL